MVELILLLIGLGVAVTVENPLNSLFWLTSFMLKLFDKYLGHFTVLQHCMHGGTRDKKSKFWSYNPRKLDANILESLASCGSDNINMLPYGNTHSRAYSGHVPRFLHVTGMAAMI